MNSRVVLSLVVLLVATSVSSTGFAAASYCHWDPATNQNVCVNEPYQLLNCARSPAGQYSRYAATSCTSTSLPVSESESDYYSSHCSSIESYRQAGRGVQGVRTPWGYYVARSEEGMYVTYYWNRPNCPNYPSYSYYANHPCYSTYARQHPCDSTYAKQYPCYSNYANNYPYCYCSDP